MRSGEELAKTASPRHGEACLRAQLAGAGSREHWSAPLPMTRERLAHAAERVRGERRLPARSRSSAPSTNSRGVENQPDSVEVEGAVVGPRRRAPDVADHDLVVHGRAIRLIGIVGCRLPGEQRLLAR